MVIPDLRELRRLRTDIESATLPDTGNILSLTRTSDGRGGWTEAWGTVTANVACRLELVQRNLGIGIEGVNNASIRPYSTWILTLPHGTAFTTANRFEYGGEAYNVTEVNANSSWLPNVRATLEKIS